MKVHNYWTCHILIDKSKNVVFLFTGVTPIFATLCHDAVMTPAEGMLNILVCSILHLDNSLISIYLGILT